MNIQQPHTFKPPTSKVPKTDEIITLDHKIVCRKCQKNHFTAKCTSGENQLQSHAPDKGTQYVRTPAPSSKPRHGSGDPHQMRPKHRQYFKTTYRVKISSLPLDITEEEVMELTNEWGHIVRANVLNYPDSNSSNAYIDFGYEEEADYFVKALDRTPFEMLVIGVSRVESHRV